MTLLILTYVQIGAAILLIITILLQQRGEGLGGSIAGGSSLEYSTRRGVQRGIFWATVVLSVVFLATSLARLWLQ